MNIYSIDANIYSLEFQKNSIAIQTVWMVYSNKPFKEE